MDARSYIVADRMLLNAVVHVSVSCFAAAYGSYPCRGWSGADNVDR